MRKIAEAVRRYLATQPFDSLNLKSLLFDMDGVLVDTMHLHATAWHEVMQRHQLPFRYEDGYLHEGRTSISTVAIAARQIGLTLTDQELLAINQEKIALYHTYPRASRMPGSLELLEQVKGEGLFAMVVTGSSDPLLSENLERMFPAIFSKELMVTARDVKKGKPSPEPYLMALERGGLQPRQAIVVENAPLGIASAKAAGMFVIAVNTGPLDDRLLLEQGADLLFSDMQALSDAWPMIYQTIKETFVNHDHDSQRAEQFAEIALTTGTYLYACGAHSGRVKGNIERLADAWGFAIDMNQTFKGLLVSVSDKEHDRCKVTSYRSSPPHLVHFAVLAELSSLTWQVVDEELSMDDFVCRFEKIKSVKHYPNWLICMAVGLSCAGLTLLAEGDLLNALVAFLAASVGSSARLWMSRTKLFPVITIGCAAFVTTLITGLGSIYQVGSSPNVAMAMSVLYLIPGVPLVNCVIDLIDGYLSSAITRGVFGAFILMSIATGMTLCMMLLGISHFR